MSAQVLCVTPGCGKPATVTLRGMCIHEHLNEESHCGRHAALLRSAAVRRGVACVSCGGGDGTLAEDLRHACMLGPIEAVAVTTAGQLTITA